MKFHLETNDDSEENLTLAVEYALSLLKKGYTTGHEPNWYIEE